MSFKDIRTAISVIITFYIFFVYEDILLITENNEIPYFKKKKGFYINIYNDAQSLMKFKCLKNIIENKKGYCNVAVRTFSDENHKKINMLLAVFC